MYYEEDIVNGMWCYRTTPWESWIPFTEAQLEEKKKSIAYFNERILTLEAQLEKYQEVLKKCHTAFHMWDGSAGTAGHWKQLYDAKQAVKEALASEAPAHDKSKPDHIVDANKKVDGVRVSEPFKLPYICKSFRIVEGKLIRDTCYYLTEEEARYRFMAFVDEACTIFKYENGKLALLVAKEPKPSEPTAEMCLEWLERNHSKSTHVDMSGTGSCEATLRINYEGRLVDFIRNAMKQEAQ